MSAKKIYKTKYTLARCTQCKKLFQQLSVHVAKVKRNGWKLYCSRTCAGAAKRIYATDEERDRALKEWKKIWRDKYRKTEKHRNYLARTKEARIKYSLKRQRKNFYGEFADAAEILHILEKQISRIKKTNKGIYENKNTVSK